MKKCSNAVLKVLIVAIATGVLLGIPSAHAQIVTGSMIGTITDSSGAVIPGAKVTITDQATNVARVFTTDQAGVYSVTTLPPSTYKVSAEKEGFSIGTHTDVQLFAAQTARVDISLQPGSVTQSVTVAGGAAPQLQTDTSEVGRAIDSTQVADLPLSQGHNFQNLINLVPGAEPAIRTHSLFMNSQNGMSAPVNGMPGRTNFFNIEGLNNNQRSGELPVYIPAMEAIQEVAVTTSNYDPAQGAALGSVVNVIIKSGSNQLHGEAYEFYGGNWMNSRAFFSVGPPGTPFHTGHTVDNYFGGNVGGAIKKDKTFFFVDVYDHRSVINYNYPLSVPTAAMRQGLFYQDPSLPMIYDPNSGDMTDCLPGGVSANCGKGRVTYASERPDGLNIVPVDPIAKTLLSHVAPCTICTTTNSAGQTVPNYGVNLPLNLPVDQYTPDLDVKVDEYLTEKDHISARYSYQDPSTLSAGPWGNFGGPLPGSGTAGAEGKGTNRVNSAGVNWVHVFSPTFLTEVRVGVNRYNNLATQAGYGQNLSTSVGVPGLDFNSNSSGIFAVNGEGFSDPLIGPFGSLPWKHPQTNISFVDNTTLVRGNHTMEMGLDYFRLRDDYIYAGNQFGAFGFGSGPTLGGSEGTSLGNSFADFLIGMPTSLSQGVIYHEPTYRQNQIFPYFGDKWQVTKRLTANIGLRWEYYAPPTSHFPGDLSNYEPNSNTIQLNGIGTNSMNDNINSEYRNWAPRVGLAYRLGSHNVLRGGFGMSSMAYPLDIYISLNYPVTTAYSFNPLNTTYGPAIVNGAVASFEGGFPAVPPAVIPSSGTINVSANPLLANTSMYYVPANWKHPYVMAWNGAFERELPGGWIFDVAYVGNRTADAAMYNNLNVSPNYGCGTACLPEIGVGRTAATYLFFGQTRNQYDSLQVKLDHHFAHDFSVTTSYTYGKAIGPSGETSDYVNGYLDYVNIKRNRARTDFDLTQMYSQSLVYFLPFGKDKKFLNSGAGAWILGGWELSGSWVAHTGFPMNFTGGQNLGAVGTTATPNETGPFARTHQIAVTGTTVKWFNTSVFSNPAAGIQGSMGYYDYSGPGFFGMNAGLTRTFKLSERFKLLLRTEWLNATNTPQFSLPNTSLGNSSTFGTISSTSGGNRTIDLVGKVIF